MNKFYMLGCKICPSGKPLFFFLETIPALFSIHQPLESFPETLQAEFISGCLLRISSDGYMEVPRALGISPSVLCMLWL